jgi:hypothetical protein
VGKEREAPSTTIRADMSFGACPQCGRTDGYFNIRRAHYFVCHKHRTKWFAGVNVFGSWRKETPSVLSSNLRRYRDYALAKPIRCTEERQPSEGVAISRVPRDLSCPEGPYWYQRGVDGCDETWDVYAASNQRPLVSIGFWEDEARAEGIALLIAAAPAQQMALELLRYGLATLGRNTFTFNGQAIAVDSEQPDWAGLLEQIGWNAARTAITNCRKHLERGNTCTEC